MVPFSGTRTPFDLAHFWKPSLCTGHVPGQVSNLVDYKKLQPRPRVYKISGVVWGSGVEYTTFFLPNDVLTASLFVEPELSWDYMQIGAESPHTLSGEKCPGQKAGRGQLRRTHHKRGAEVSSHGQNDARLKETQEFYLWPQSSGVIPGRRKA